MMWNSKEVIAVFSNFSCYFGFTQISAHKLRGTGALGNLLTKHSPIGTIRSNLFYTPNMWKYMLRNTDTSINSSNNNNRNRRITVILALCKLCILYFLTSSRWKMHIKVRCVFEEYQILKTLRKSNKKKTVIKIMKSIPILSLCN